MMVPGMLFMKWVAVVGSWQNNQLDLSTYTNESSVRIAFHTNDNGAWASGWCIDNVKILNGIPDSKSLQAFNLYHNGNLSGATNEYYYDYEANENLVSGETYLAEVEAVYTTGISEKVAY